MKISFVVLILLIRFGAVMSQGVMSPIDSVAVDSAMQEKRHVDKPVRKKGFWLATWVEATTVAEASGPNLGLGLCFISSGQYYLGVYGILYKGRYSERLIFPNQFDMKYSHAGIWAGYRTKKLGKLRFTMSARVGQGKVFWERQDNFYNMFEDYALFVQPSVGVDYQLINFLALHTEIGYRSVSGLDLPGVSNADFSGMTANIMIKIGLF